MSDNRPFRHRPALEQALHLLRMAEIIEQAIEAHQELCVTLITGETVRFTPERIVTEATATDGDVDIAVGLAYNPTQSAFGFRGIAIAMIEGIEEEGKRGT
jgi:hypothetical protein